MAYNNGKITKAVSIYDVQRALSTNDNDVGRLCVHGAIKKWARFKPIRDTQIAPLTHAVIASSGKHFGLNVIRNGNWNQFKNDLGAYIGLKYGSTQQATICGILSGKHDWDDGVYYLKPSVANGDTFRLTDFVSAENDNFGYKNVMEPLPHWPDYSALQIPLADAVISSVIHPLITGTDPDGVSYIEMDSLQDQNLPDDSHIFNAVNTPMSIAGKTHDDYNHISIPEIIKSVMNTGGVERGVVLIDTTGFVSEYRAEGTIPWTTWANTQDECTLYGEWVCVEYLLAYGGTEYCIIPTFENLIRFRYGSPSYPQLAFTKDPAIGICLSAHQYYMFISFSQITTEDLNNWDVRVSLIKNYGTAQASTYMNRAELADTSIFQRVYSGGVWYQTYINVDYGESWGSNVGDVFTLVFEYKERGTSQQERKFYLTNIVLTV